MKIGNKLLCPVALGIFLLGFSGCGQPELDDLNNNAVVIVRCDNLVTNGLLIHRVTEMWRDESNHVFPYKKGDFINAGIPVDKRNIVGDESLLIYRNINGKLRLSPRVLTIHSGKVIALGNIHVSEMQRKLDSKMQ